jgi:hypothetical protein
MTTSEMLSGAKQYPKTNLILPMEALDIKIEDPENPDEFPRYAIVDEEGNKVDAHTIRSYCSQNNATWKPLAGGTHFIYAVEAYDLYNHMTKVKTIMQSYGFVLGGEDFSNPDPKAFWVLEYALLKIFRETSDLDKAQEEM